MTSLPPLPNSTVAAMMRIIFSEASARLTAATRPDPPADTEPGAHTTAQEKRTDTVPHSPARSSPGQQAQQAQQRQKVQQRQRRLTPVAGPGRTGGAGRATAPNKPPADRQPVPAPRTPPPAATAKARRAKRCGT